MKHHFNIVKRGKTIQLSKQRQKKKHFAKSESFHNKNTQHLGMEGNRGCHQLDKGHLQ